MSKPVFSEKGSWGKVNSFFGLAVVAKCRLGGFPLALLCYIVGEYNKGCYSAPYEDIKIPLTYQDAANKGNTYVSTMQEAIKVLLDEKLIEKANCPKGRAKTLFIPNETLLNKWSDEYIEHNPDDKTQQQYKPM